MMPSNEENVSSSQAAERKASAALEPSTTRDPVPGRYTAPTIGSGTTTEYRFPVGDKPRNPIGFAPSADRMPPRYVRTEVSFKFRPADSRAGGNPGGHEVVLGEPTIAATTVECSVGESAKAEQVAFYK